MDLRNALITLFTETFEGVGAGADGTFYVQGREALLPLLSCLSAAEASDTHGTKASSIAAHAIHTTYYMHLLNEVFSGGQPVPDWDASWEKQVVSDSEWETVQAEMRREYRMLRAGMETATPRNPDEETYLLAQLAHAAFHLGSVRQLAMIIAPDLSV